MLRNEKIDIRLRALKFNLDQINDAYEQTFRDYITDTGLEYGKQYPYNEQTIKIVQRAEELKKSREDMLFFYIFNFTQVYYSLKEYLRKEYPAKKGEIEAFYSTRQVGFQARKDMSNDLKHNPTKDLKYEQRTVDIQKSREGNVLRTTYISKQSWFYYEIDSVEYCNKLYKELTDFIRTEFVP